MAVETWPSVTPTQFSTDLNVDTPTRATDLDRRVVGSFMTMTSVTSPNLLKYSRSPSADVCQLSPPINIFLWDQKKIKLLDKSPAAQTIKIKQHKQTFYHTFHQGR